jgi:hypothetical protein
MAVLQQTAMGVALISAATLVVETLVVEILASSLF